MAIKGSLKEASLPDVLQLLAMGKKTGCLAVTHRNNFGYVYFDKGRICYASIVNRRDRIGDLLVKGGAITKAQLDAAIAAQAAHNDKRIGELLIAQGALSRDQLHDRIRLQIEEAVYYLFTWTAGTFNFEGDVKPEEQDYLVSINPESLLLEGARRVDEWSLIEKKIPSFDLVFDFDRKKVADSEVELTREQAIVAELLDGRRDVAAVIDQSGLGEFDVGKTIYGMITAGFAHRVGRTKAAEPAVSDSRVDEHRNLGVAFYKTGMLDEAMREFRRVAELRAPTAAWYHYAALTAALLGDLERAVSLLQEGIAAHPHAATLFNNLAAVHERRGQYPDALQVGERGVLEDAGLAQLHKNLGDLHYRAARYDDALECLQRAVKINPQLGDDVYLKLGNIRFKRQEREEAVRCWEQALALDPGNAIVRTNLDAVRQVL